MSKQALNIGSTANDNTGDTLRAGGDKLNDNFNEIYGALGNGLDIQVDISNAGVGQVLRYSGTSFVASDFLNLTSALDVNGNSIISSNNGNISIAPNGTGDVTISNGSVTNTFDGATGDIDLPTKVKYKNEYATLGVAPSAVNYPGYFFTVDGDDRPYVNINITAGGVGDTRAALLTQYSGIDDLVDVDTTTVAPTDGQTLIWDNANSKWEPGTLTNIANSSLANSGITINNTLVPLGGSITVEGGGGGGGGGGIAEVSSDTTPQLGGDLDLNSNNITGTGNINITGGITVDGSGDTIGKVVLEDTGSYSQLQFFDTTGSAGVALKGVANNLYVEGGGGEIRLHTYASFSSNGNIILNNGENGNTDIRSQLTVLRDTLSQGFKLNTNYNGYAGLTGSVGDIKRINEHPHYYDGTTWRPFYLSGTPLSVTTSDVNFDDVQVRMDFEQGTVPFNHVNQRNARILVSNPGGGTDISIVTNPTKFGTKCLKLFTTNGIWNQDYFYWQSRRNETYASNWTDPDIYAQPEIWSNAKRGGSLDWSQDWTLEFWIRFEDIFTTADNERGIFFSHDPSNPTNGSQGLVLKEGAQAAWALYWYNYRGGLTKQVQLQPSSTANYQPSTWYFISLTYDASTGEFLLHKDGINVTLTSGNTPIDLEVDACNSDASNSNDFRTYFGKFMTQDGGANNFEYSNQMYLDDLRITQFARYDSTNYAVPTAALPITADAPPTVDPDWSNVVVRSTFDTNANNIAAGAPNGGVPHFQHSSSQIVTTGQKYGSGALRHDNGSAYLNYYNSASPFDPSGTWTVEFWLNIDNFPSLGLLSGEYFTIWSQTYSSGGGDHSFGLLWTANNYNYNGIARNAFKFFWRNGATVSHLHSDHIPSPILKQYNHVAVVRNGNGDIVVYFNGYKLRHNAQDTTVFTDTNVTYTTNSSFRIGIAEDPISTNDDSFDGIIDDFRVTTTVKYTENFTPPSGPLPTTGTVTNDPPGAAGGFLTYPTGNGTSGQVLTSDGNGSVTWSNITEADTLDSVVSRGSTTTQSIILNGSGNRSLQVQSSNNFAITLDAGSGIKTNANNGLFIGNFGTNAWYAEINGSNGNIDTRGNITAVGSLTAGGLTYPTANGSSGQVLTSTGSGGVTWADVPGSTLTWTLGADGSNHFTFSGPGFPTTTNDPTLYVMRGMTYAFDNTANGSSHPFRIQSTTGTSGTPYTSGTSGSGTSILYWTVPMNAPNTLYYQCTSHSLMQGTITVVS